MNTNIPIPDSPLSAILEFDLDIPDIQPGDIIRLNNQSGKTEVAYEILSIRENNRVLLHEQDSEEIELMEKDELAEKIERYDPYVWTLLNREFLPIENHECDTIAVFIYAVEAPPLPEGQRTLAVQWCITPQRPVRNMPDVDGLIMDVTFESLRKTLTTGELGDTAKESSGDISSLHDEMEGEFAEAMDLTVIAAEYNAQKMFEMHTEPTYDDEMARRLERESVNRKAAIETANSVYR